MLNEQPQQDQVSQFNYEDNHAQSSRSLDKYSGRAQTERFNTKKVLAKRYNGAEASKKYVKLPDIPNGVRNMFAEQLDGFSYANSGPRFDENGQIVPYSLAGKADWFVQRDLRAKGLIDDTPEVVDTSLRARNRAVSLALKDRLRSKSKHQRVMPPQEPDYKEEPLYLEEDLSKDQLVAEIEDVLDRVKQNRQAEFTQSKELQRKIDPGELLYVTKDTRTLEKFNNQQRVWQETIQRTSATVRRQFDNSIYMVSENFRAKRETQRVLDILEPDDKRYGERYWMMTLRNYGHNMIGKRPSQKVIDDLPASFNTYQPVRQDSQLEIVRKPISSKLRSKYEGMPPFSTFKSGEYFKKRLQESSLKGIKHLDDTGYELLEVTGTNKLKSEIENLLIKDTQTNESSNNHHQSYKRKYHKDEYQRFEDASISRTEQDYDETEQIIDLHYDTKRLSKIGGLSLKTYSSNNLK